MGYWLSVDDHLQWKLTQGNPHPSVLFRHPRLKIRPRNPLQQRLRPSRYRRDLPQSPHQHLRRNNKFRRNTARSRPSIQTPSYLEQTHRAKIPVFTGEDRLCVG